MPSHHREREKPAKLYALAQDKQRVELKGRHYVVDGKRVGKGQFAEVYRALEASSGAASSSSSGGQTLASDGIIALKVEREDATLMHEYKVLKALQGTVDGVCKVYDIDLYDGRRYMIMQLLGDNLSTLRKACTATEGRLSWDSTRTLGLEMLRALQQVHSEGYVHRDVKPSNFALGRLGSADANKVFIIDFGLARKYLEDNGWAHQPERANRRFRGSSAYASVNAHEERDLSRRDDLWSLLYLMVEFLTGNLPWRKACADQDKDEVLRLKQECIRHPEKLAPEGQSLRPELLAFSNHLASLSFMEDPKYDTLSACLGPPLPAPPVYEFERHRAAEAEAGPSGEAMDVDGPTHRNAWRLKPDSQEVGGWADGTAAGGAAAGHREPAARRAEIPKGRCAIHAHGGGKRAGGRADVRVQVLDALLRLESAQAMAVIASALEAVALPSAAGKGAAGGVGGGGKEGKEGKDRPRAEVAEWLYDVAAHAVGLHDLVTKGSGGGSHKRREVAMR